MLEVHRESGGFTPRAPLNRVHPVKFTPVIAKRISLGYPQGVQPGWNPWGYFPGTLFRVPHSVLGIRKCAMLAIPLGLCHSKKRFPKSSINAVFVELFYVYSCEWPLVLSNKNRT